MAYKKIQKNAILRSEKQNENTSEMLVKIQLQRVTSKTFPKAIKPFIRKKRPWLAICAEMSL